MKFSNLNLIKKICHKQNSSSFGINIIGHFQGEFGTGEAVRKYSIAIKRKRIPFVLNNIIDGYNRNNDKTFNEFSKNNPYPINLIALNANLIQDFYESKNKNYFKKKYNIGLWFWELSTFPKVWYERFKYFDEIWVASDFIADSIKKISPIPVLKIMCPIEIDDKKIFANRSKFKINQDDYAFLFIFDFDSVFERKNPIGLINAFSQAFEENEKVVLVIKVIGSERHPMQMKLLVEACHRKNILLLDKRVTKDDVYSLIGSIDCYISLHRSEGFGLTIADAMFAKKPVIATAYGGNTDFMNDNNSFPVKYELIKIEKNYGPYEKGNVWANPDLTHAQYLMRQIYENQDLGRKIGKIAHSSIKSQMSYDVIGDKILNRINELIGDKKNL